MFEQENAFFELHFPALLEKYRDKELVISGDRILGVYDNVRTADAETKKTRKSGTYCIKRVEEDALEPIIVYGAVPVNLADNAL
jgi:hypothetical protein